MSPVHRHVTFSIPRADAARAVTVTPRYHEDQREPGGWWTLDVQADAPEWSIRPEALRELVDQLERDDVR